MTGSDPNGLDRKANVLLVLRVSGPISEQVLEAVAIDVLEAVERHAGEIALDPALAFNPHERTIELRFDLIAMAHAELQERIGAVLAVIEGKVDLRIDSVQTAVAAGGEGAGPSRSEFAP